MQGSPRFQRVKKDSDARRYDLIIVASGAGGASRTCPNALTVEHTRGLGHAAKYRPGQLKTA